MENLRVILGEGNSAEEEASLLQQLREGDADAGHRFIRQYYPGVYRYLLYLTGRSEAAEDLTQETFLQAWRRLDQFQGRSSLRLWLHRIAHRELLQAVRSRRSELSLEEVDEPAHSRGPDWTEAMELRDALGKLPIEEREIMVLHYQHGYSCEEIARIVRTHVSTVKYRLSTGRARLQRELGEGDLLYLNEQGSGMGRWGWLPLDQMHALEAQLRLGGPRNALCRAPADAGSDAAAAGQRETEIVDSRLTRKMSLAFKAVALADLCARLRADSGVHLAAGASVADEKVTLFCAKTPLREVMRQLSRPFGYTWLRSGKAGEYRYELAQDLRSQLLEEELRNRDRNTAFLVLEREIERFRAYRDLSPDEALARAKSAPPEEKALMEKLAGYGWGGIQMYFRLTPQQQAALRAGEELQFSQEPKAGEQPLPAEIGRGVLQSLRDVFFTRGPEGFGLALGVKEPAPQHIPLTSLPEARARVSLSIRETEPGRVALTYSAGSFSHSELRNSGGSWRQGDGTLALGAGPAVVKPDNRAANARLADDPVMRRRVSMKPEGGCGADPTPGPSPGRRGAGGGVRRATTADLLEALHRATGLPVVADFYTRLYDPAALTVADQPLFDALNRLTDAMHVRWQKEGEWLQFRSASFYDDRLKEVPNRLLARWSGARREHGLLRLDDLVEIAGLSDAQLDARDMAEGARDCWGLAEWSLAQSETLRPHLRFLAELTPAQRLEAMTASGLEFGKLALAQQQRYIALALGGDDQPLRSLEELGGATLRIEYTRPGGFEWRPSGSNVLRWVVPVVPGQEGRRALMPRVRGRTRDEALAAAGRLDSRRAEALLGEAQRADPQAASVPVSDRGEVVPSELNLWAVYVPGLSNRRGIFIVDRQSTSRLSSW